MAHTTETEERHCPDLFSTLVPCDCAPDDKILALKGGAVQVCEYLDVRDVFNDQRGSRVELIVCPKSELAD